MLVVMDGMSFCMDSMLAVIAGMQVADIASSESCFLLLKVPDKFIYGPNSSKKDPRRLRGFGFPNISITFENPYFKKNDKEDRV